MHLEGWQSVNNRLLLCCDETIAPRSLEPALPILRQCLPDADIALWFTDSNTSNLLHCPGIQVVLIQNWVDPNTLKQLHQQAFEAAIIFTGPRRSPYAIAYLCYLAGIPIRLGQSEEFGGGVLSSCIKPPIDPVSPTEYSLHLLRASGFPVDSDPLIQIR